MTINARALQKGRPPRRASSPSPIAAADRRPAEAKTKPLQVIWCPPTSSRPSAPGRG